MPPESRKKSATISDPSPVIPAIHLRLNPVPALPVPAFPGGAEETMRLRSDVWKIEILKISEPI